MFLTPQQLQELTGYVQPAAQIRWLQKNGIKHYIRADGKPRVLVGDIRQREGSEPAPTRPDFEALAVRH